MLMCGGIIAQPDGNALASPPIAIAGKAIVALGTVLIFLGFRGSEAGIWPKPLVYLGKISFGLYVFHDLVYTLVMVGVNAVGLGVRTGPGHSITNVLISGLVVLPVTFGGTLAVSAFSYKYLETPFLRLKDRFAVVHSRAI